jgi:hypothetical protein
VKILTRIFCLLRAPLDFLDHLVEERKLVRRALVVWAAALITIVTLDVLDVMRKMEEVTTPVTSFYLGVTALLTAVVGFYQWSREKDDAAGKDRSDEQD